MTKLRRFGWFWYDFVVGDDWTIAVVVVVAVTVTAVAAHAGRPAWPVMPIAVLAVLGSSLRHAVRARSRGSGPPV
jgi:hypothetical protein